MVKYPNRMPIGSLSNSLFIGLPLLRGRRDIDRSQKRMTEADTGV